MLDWASERVGDLPPTATYHARFWHWIPTREPEPEGRAGNLGIGLESDKGTQESYYTVVEKPALAGLIGRAFVLTKYLGDGEQEPIEVVVGAVPRCECTAGKHGKDCKHQAAMAAVVAAGLLEPKVEAQ